MNVPAAIAALVKSGLTLAGIVTEVGVHRTTVSRWSRGLTKPNADNLTALRRLAADQLGAAGLSHRARANASRAVEDLESDQEKAELAWLADSIARSIEQSLREPVVPIAHQADPFALCAPAGDLDTRLNALFA